MRPDDLLESLKTRFAKGKAGYITISADEIAEWPDGLFNELHKANLLTQAAPTNVLECRGCEQLCFMPVNIVAAENGRKARAFIACDKRDDVGRVPVAFARLEQWAMTHTAFDKILNGFILSASTTEQSLKRSKAPLAFRISLEGLLKEIITRAAKQGVQFDVRAMPGRKLDFQELANLWDSELRHTARTFDDYLQGICAFKRGARETDFYRTLFPECFK